MASVLSHSQKSPGIHSAESQGFEPWEVSPSLVFKASAFVRSANSPIAQDFHDACARRPELRPTRYAFLIGVTTPHDAL
jgi:hypothetical protein